MNPSDTWLSWSNVQTQSYSDSKAYFTPKFSARAIPRFSTLRITVQPERIPNSRSRCSVSVEEPLSTTTTWSTCGATFTILSMNSALGLYVTNTAQIVCALTASSSCGVVLIVLGGI